MSSVLHDLTKSLDAPLSIDPDLVASCAFCITCDPVGPVHKHCAPHDCATNVGLIHAAAVGGHEDIVLSCIAEGSDVDGKDSVIIELDACAMTASYGTVVCL